MSEHDVENDDRTRKRDATRESQAGHLHSDARFASELATAPIQPGHVELTARGSEPARNEALLGMQRTQGNRAVQRFVQRQVAVQCDEDKDRRLKLNLLPPSLQMPLGPLDTTLSPGGLELGYQRGGFRAGAEYGWGGPLDLSLGYGAPLLPWMMDVEPSLAAGAGGINGLMNGRPSGALGAIGGMAGTLGDIADAGEPSRYRWGAGLQGSIGPDEQRIMAGLRLDF